MTEPWISTDRRITLHVGDCLTTLAGMEPRSVDLVFGSPPYEAKRTYGIGFSLSGEEWVSWFKQVVIASLRVTRGLAAFVVDGSVTDGAYSGVAEMVVADLIRDGYRAWRPAAYVKNAGIPGGGGKQMFRADWEQVIQFVGCEGPLPWADNAACGQPCKFSPGGGFGNRTTDGRRTSTLRQQMYRRDVKGRRPDASHYTPPRIANPGNAIALNPVDFCQVVKCFTGGGQDDQHAHENEAPFPEALVERWIRSYVPPGGTVLDPFVGSGTTMAVAYKWERNGIGIDIRQSQIDLTTRRLTTLTPSLAVPGLPADSSLFEGGQP